MSMTGRAACASPCVTGEAYCADYDPEAMLLTRYNEWFAGGMCECCQAVDLEVGLRSLRSFCFTCVLSLSRTSRSLCGRFQIVNGFIGPRNSLI
jgi:hypothetical protein